jgi:apolipoprotein D and lipocalin family protein
MKIKKSNRPPHRRHVGIALLLYLISACAGIETKAVLPVVPSVDLDRYAGTWYEIARLPMWFQRHCVDSKATYTSRSDGTIGVRNECVTDDGGTATAEGTATVVDTKTNARLKVIFDNWFARLFGSFEDSNYWILDLDAEYHTALVGTPDRRYLWILARSSQIDSTTYERLVLIGRELGYPMDELIRDQRVRPAGVDERSR